MIHASDIRKLAPRAKPEIISGLLDGEAVLAKYGITTSPLRLAHFMAQIAHESAGFRTTREYASGAAYEGRRDLGNTQKDDGRRFRGRGLIQSTGRANYTRAERETGIPLTREPERAEQFPAALEVTCLYWSWRNLSTFADRNDIRAITLKINGGLNGFTDRKRYFNTAWSIWKDGDPALSPSGRPADLALGSVGPEVRDVQKRLARAGQAYRTEVDGIFGPLTRHAVQSFQRDHGLAADGIIGPATRARLITASKTGVLPAAGVAATATATGAALADPDTLLRQLQDIPAAPAAIAGLAAGVLIGLTYTSIKEFQNARNHPASDGA